MCVCCVLLCVCVQCVSVCCDMCFVLLYANTGRLMSADFLNCLLPFFFSFFATRSPCAALPELHYVDQASLDRTEICLHLLPKCQDQRHVRLNTDPSYLLRQCHTEFGAHRFSGTRLVGQCQRPRYLCLSSSGLLTLCHALGLHMVAGNQARLSHISPA